MEPGIKVEDGMIVVRMPIPDESTLLKMLYQITVGGRPVQLEVTLGVCPELVQEMLQSANAAK
jgi:hypothetical protein